MIIVFIASHLNVDKRYYTIEKALHSIKLNTRPADKICISYSYAKHKPDTLKWKEIVYPIPLICNEHSTKQHQFCHYQSLLPYANNDDIITSLDDDDYYDELKIETVFSHFEKYPTSFICKTLHVNACQLNSRYKVFLFERKNETCNKVSHDTENIKDLIGDVEVICDIENFDNMIQYRNDNFTSFTYDIRDETFQKFKINVKMDDQNRFRINSNNEYFDFAIKKFKLQSLFDNFIEDKSFQDYFLTENKPIILQSIADLIFNIRFKQLTQPNECINQICYYYVRHYDIEKAWKPNSSNS